MSGPDDRERGEDRVRSAVMNERQRLELQHRSADEDLMSEQPEWREATDPERDAVIDDLLAKREQASEASGTAALGYELDEDGEILWWVSPGFLLKKGRWAEKDGED